MPSRDAIADALALLQECGLLKPTNNEKRRIDAWEMVLHAASPDEDLRAAVRRLARKAEKQYGAVTPKQLNTELQAIRSSRISTWLAHFKPLDIDGNPFNEAAYKRAVLAAIGDGAAPEQADREGQAAVAMANTIARDEPGTNPFQLLQRMSNAIQDGQRPWRAWAHKYEPHDPPCQVLGQNPNVRTFQDIQQVLTERNDSSED